MYCYYLPSTIYPGFATETTMITIGSLMKTTLTTASTINYYPNQAASSYISVAIGTTNAWYCISMAYTSTEPLAYIFSPDISSSGSYV